MSVNDCFSRDYDDARSKFLSAGQRAHGSVVSHQIPHCGPKGQDLFTDVCWLGAKDARKVLLLISGTHGAEGLCGSGAQVGAITRMAKSVPEDIAFLLVHAINPYGFAWQRRATEEGIDLCRNFLNFENALPENPLFDELVDFLVPREWTGPVRDRADKGIKDCVDKIGMRGFLERIPLGQYKHAHAPFFGGRGPSRANLAFRDVVKTYLSDATDVAALDYHTGLGPYGHGELLCFHQPGSIELARARKWWGDALTSVFASDTVAYPLTGGIHQALEVMLPEANVTVAAYEFGTVEPMKVVDALRADHWLHTYGDLDSPSAGEIKRNMFDTFYGDTDAWRHRVWEQSEWAMVQAINGLSAD